MRPIARPLTALLLCLTALTLSSGCETLDKVLSNADRPQASVVGASLSDLDTQSVTLDFDVDIRNPYSVPLPLTSLTYDLASRGTPFLKGSTALSGAVPAGGSRTITLPAQVRFSDLFASLSGVRPGQIVPYDAGLKLSVDAPGIGPIALPLRRKGELPVPAVPDVRLASLNWEELSLTNARAVMRLNVKNTNQFPLNLSALDTSLSLAGRNLGRTSISEAIRLSPGKTGTLDVPISFSPLQFGASVLGILRGESADYTLDGAVRGDTPFGPISLPFARSGQTPLTGG